MTPFAFQVLAALIVGVAYYMLGMMMTVYDGALSLLFQPVIGTLLTSVVIALLLIVGLPIRFNQRLNNWWQRHWWIVFPLSILAFGMMYASWHPHYRIQVMDPELESLVPSFHPFLAIGGWMLTIFAVLHFYPPLPWLRPRRMDP